MLRCIGNMVAGGTPMQEKCLGEYGDGENGHIVFHHQKGGKFIVGFYVLTNHGT